MNFGTAGLQADAGSMGALKRFGPTLTAAIGVVLRAVEGGRGSGSRKQRQQGQQALRHASLGLLRAACASAMLLTCESLLPLLLRQPWHCSA